MDTVHSVLTVSGAAGIVASIVEATEFPFDLIKDPIVSNRAKRLWVFLVAFALVAVEVYRRLGYHSNGDLLGLCATAATVAGTAIFGWSLLNGKLKTQPVVTAIAQTVPGSPFQNPMTTVGDMPVPTGKIASVTPVPPEPTPENPGPTG